MNSEELELSLRTEFESHLKDVLADLQQEFSQFQEKIETEFDKHKSQLDAIIRDFSTRIPTEGELNDVFKETVIEHLRLARDEGARITATAITEAEEMQKESAPKIGLSELRDAINDITQQTSQAAILKTLVNHAARFAPRGAFFIIKNEHFVGWRVFGDGGGADEQNVREILFPVASSTVLGESIRSLSPVETSYGTYNGDSIYLNKLEFGQPNRMFAVPLIVRGRGVAVLYADYGAEGESVNIEDLETMVRIAGLTVELLAGSPAVKPAQEMPQTADDEQKFTEETEEDVEDSLQSATETAQESVESVETDEEYQETLEDSSEADAPETFDYQTSDEAAETVDYASGAADDYSAEPEEVEEVSEEVTTSELASDEYSADEEEDSPAEIEPVAESNAWDIAEEVETADESYSWNQSEESAPETANRFADEAGETSFEYQPPTVGDFTAPSTNGFAYDETPPTSEDFDYEETKYKPVTAPQFDASEGFAPVQETYDSFGAKSSKTESYTQEPATIGETVAAAPVRSRFSDRNVDLPIEVSEDERRLHNDARRFARLLVSEIKLYNEQKVKEGREISDLYERLREAIDRSREMYDKRVQPPVAAKFDYFHYELVNTLADGEENKLGEGYPGATV